MQMLTKKYDSKGNFYYVDGDGNKFYNKPNPTTRIDRWITGEKPPPLDPSIKRVYQKIPPNKSELRERRPVDYLLMKNSALSRKKREAKISKLSVDEKLYMASVLNAREMEQYIVDHEVPELTGYLTWEGTE
jgi:hypothetical protein